MYRERRQEVADKVGDRIRVLRRNKGLSQPDLEKLTGCKIKQPMICEYECGTKLGKYDKLSLIATALGTTIDILAPEVAEYWEEKNRPKRKYIRR